jgi:hypothetical protein
MECAECRRTSGYLKHGFLVKGGTPKFHIDVGDLPPSDEADDWKKQHGGKTV